MLRAVGTVGRAEQEPGEEAAEGGHELTSPSR